LHGGWTDEVALGVLQRRGTHAVLGALGRDGIPYFFDALQLLILLGCVCEFAVRVHHHPAGVAQLGWRQPHKRVAALVAHARAPVVRRVPRSGCRASHLLARAREVAAPVV